MTRRKKPKFYSIEALPDGDDIPTKEELREMVIRLSLLLDRALETACPMVKCTECMYRKYCGAVGKRE